jgi:hypothetical protein
MLLTPTSEQRLALERAATLLTHQAEGLRLTGSKTAQGEIHGYAGTLRAIAAAPHTTLGDNERLHIENASFVLEGVRDGLLTNEFRDRAAAINADIATLNDIVGDYNAAPSEQGG